MRPELDSNIKPEIFLEYYWLKQELVDFCIGNSLPKSGSKQDLSERIVQYLRSGVIIKVTRNKVVKKPRSSSPLSLNSTVDIGYRNDEEHREFFKSVIGSHFKFNVQFMDWMKKNVGKTYQEAVNEWNRIYELKKAGKKYKISSQFEYNQYTRDFFEANPKLRREDSMTCWKYKKSQPGSNKYEDEDLNIL